MGEAKRRKQTGEPSLTAVEDFRVPGGKLGITVEIDDEAPSTFVFDVDKLGELFALFAQFKGAPPSYRWLAREFLRVRRDGEDLTGIGGGFLWSVFHHPLHGVDMRKGVSRFLRARGKAHVTWRLTSKGLCMSVGVQYEDLDDVLALAPRGQAWGVEFPVDGEPNLN